MKLLAFECSAKAASVAIVDGERLLCEFYSNMGLTHSQTLLPMAKSAIESCGITLSDIDGFAISSGPGSFTGLRIGISAVKGLAIADNKPCVGVSTLYSMALSQINSEKIVVSCMDARCRQCYCAIFLSDGEKIIRISEDSALSMEELCGKIKDANEKFGKSGIIVGDGAQLFMNTAGQDLSFLRLADENLRYQSARYVASAALPEFYAGNTVSAAELLPMYLRLPQAERELKKKLKEN